MLWILVAQLAVASPASSGVSDQDRINATEIFAYGQWRNCVLKATHHMSRRIKDHGAAVDAAIAECGTKEANYRSSLTSLATLYQLKDTAGFVQRDVEQARKALRDLAMKELS